MLGACIGQVLITVARELASDVIFGCDRSVINGAEHEEQRTIWSVYRLPLEGFS